jgi:hypothetical protein
MGRGRRRREEGGLRFAELVLDSLDELESFERGRGIDVEAIDEIADPVRNGFAAPFWSRSAKERELAARRFVETDSLAEKVSSELE